MAERITRESWNYIVEEIIDIVKYNSENMARAELKEYLTGEDIIEVIDDGEEVKYWLDFDPFNGDHFILKTRDGNDMVYSGLLSEVTTDADSWQDDLDRLFERELGIMPDEWEIG